MGLPFEILYNDELLFDLDSDNSHYIKKEFILSLINDFEDGKWYYENFNNYIRDSIVQTTLSADERDKLFGNPHTQLIESAKKLRRIDADQASEGSELAEILLYGIMKDFYGALPIVPKIFYKQNTQDNAKGADSVHIIVNNDENDFTLWLGEAKFYNSIENVRLSAIITSVYNGLQTDKLKKENSIITGLNDINKLCLSQNVIDKIKEELNTKRSIDHIRKKLHIPILLLHECEITQGETCLSDDYKKAIKTYHIERANAYFKKQIVKIKSIYGYKHITFHIILIPVPEKEIIVKNFLGNIDFYLAS